MTTETWHFVVAKVLKAVLMEEHRARCYLSIQEPSKSKSNSVPAAAASFSSPPRDKKISPSCA